MTQTEAKWGERVRDWRASGRTAGQFSEGQGFKASTLRFWASHLRGKASAVAAAPVAQEDAGRVRLVRVRRTRGRMPIPTEGSASATTRESVSNATMGIAIGTARIEVRA